MLSRPARVCLIRPPSIVARYAITLNATPPLALAYLAGSLEAAGFAVDPIDSVGEALGTVEDAGWRSFVRHGLAPSDVVARIDPSAGWVCVSCAFTHEWPSIRRLVSEIRAALPDAPIILGGEHVSALPEYSLRSAPEADYLVLGEGEETLVELLTHLRARQGAEGVAGIAYRAGGGVVVNAARPRIRAVDRIPPPAWGLFDLEPYLGGGWSFGVNRGRTMPLLATRGCPYACAFCSSQAMWGQRYHPRDPRLVIDEIEGYVRDYGIEAVDFYDQTAIIKRAWIVDLCRLFIDRGLGITWQLPSGVRSEAIDEEVARLLHGAGCRNVSVAPESGSPRVLAGIEKRLDLDSFVRSASDLVAQGINVKANIIMGFPGETRGDILRSCRLLARMARAGVHDSSVWLYSPYPGTGLFESLRRDGTIGELDDDYFASLLAYSDLTSEVSYNEGISARELKYYRLLAEALFYAMRYSSPRRVLATARNLATGDHQSRMETTLANLIRRLKALTR